MTFFIAALLLVNICLVQVQKSECSQGEQYIRFTHCKNLCAMEACEKDRKQYSPNARKNWFVELLWSCIEDCEYTCMWPTLEALSKENKPVPQFYGKWPFVRFLGMQEPASVIFSVLNLLSVIVCCRRFYSMVPPRFDMWVLWTLHAAVGICTWICSAVYHTRETEFTTKCDYVGAFFFVFATNFVFGYRILYSFPIFRWIFAIANVCFGYYHLEYLLSGHYDYVYSQQVVVNTGLLTGVMVLMTYAVSYRQLPHFKHAALYVTATMLAALLEVYDFPPIFWIFDSHSVWHLATVPLTPILYKFIVFDMYHLRYGT